MKKQWIGAILLLLTTIIWGVAFVAQSAASDSIGAFTFNAARSLIAAALLSVALPIKEKIAQKNLIKSGQTYDKTGRHAHIRKSLISGIFCGLALFAAVNFQQFGIEKYPEGVSSSGRAGFLTATYVVIVAAYTMIRRKKLHIMTLVSCIGCLCGMYLLCMHGGGISAIYLGDILELLGAISFAVQILIVDRYSDLDGVSLSCTQFWTTGIISAVCAVIFEKISFSSLGAAWLPIAYAGVMSSCLGYTFQILGQQHVRPVVASMIMSLESVFAALAGWIILHESLTGVEMIGCALVFVSVILSQAFSDNAKDGKKDIIAADTTNTQDADEKES